MFTVKVFSKKEINFLYPFVHFSAPLIVSLLFQIANVYKIKVK